METPSRTPAEGLGANDLDRAPAGTHRSPAPPAAALVALTTALVCGLSLLLFAPALALFDPTDLPDPFPDQHQRAENFLFVFTLVIALPLGLLVVPRLSDRVVAAGNAAVLPTVSVLLLASLAAVGVFVKLSERLPWGGGLGTLAAALGLWWLGAAAIFLLALRSPPGSVLTWARHRPRLIWAATAAVAVLLLLSFTDLRKVSVPVLIVGALLSAVLIFVSGRPAGPFSRRLGGGPGAALDTFAGLLLFAAALNLVIFTPEDPAAAFQTEVIQFHQNFLLGPANHVLAGDAMLVDTFSQYGVGSIYLLAGWFQLAPAGNGTLGFLDGALSAATFVAAFAICRISGTPRLLAAGALGVSVVVLTYGLVYPLGALLQHGGLRFGLPLALLLAAVVESRWIMRPEVAKAARAAGLAVVGISAVWALEGFIYTTATVVGLLVVGALLQSPAERPRWVRRRLLAVLGAWLVAHLLLAGLTLIFAGALPKWGAYLDTLYTFLAGPVGDLTYDFSPFSPALLVVGAYLASVIGLATVWRSRPDVFRRERTLMLAIAGTTAYGVALFSYFVNRSSDHILPYVSLPLVIAGVLWLTLLMVSPELGGSRVWRSGLALASSVAVIAVSVAAPAAEGRFSDSALGHLLPGGESASTALKRLWNPPALNPAAPEGVRLLERHMPDERRSLVVTSADLGVEILVRSGRANTLPLADPWEDSLVPLQHIDALEQTIADLKPGDRMLIDEGAAVTFGLLRRDPGLDPIADPLGASTLVPSGLAILQQEAMREIGLRFSMRTLVQGERGLRVVELVER